MKCLTVCQPYAALIVTPQSELPRNFVQKRVENRSWNCHYRGPLLIHAGKSTRYLAFEPTFPRDGLPFGAIVGVCDVVGCAEVKSWRLIDWTIDARDGERWPWLVDHPHAEGPFCIILENVRRFERPIPYKGAQGLFNVPDRIVDDQLSRTIE